MANSKDLLKPAKGLVGCCNIMEQTSKLEDLRGRPKQSKYVLASFSTNETENLNVVSNTKNFK